MAVSNLFNKQKRRVAKLRKCAHAQVDGLLIGLSRSLPQFQFSKYSKNRNFTVSTRVD